MAYRPNPQDTPRPLPLNNVRSPAAANEAPALQRLNPDNRESAAGHRIAGTIVEAAIIESRFAYTPAHRAAVAAAFEEYRAWKRGAEAAAVEEVQRDALDDYYSGRCRER